MTECVGLPAERFSHAGIFDILVCGETLDKDCDHLHRDVLDQAGQSNGRVKRWVCKKRAKEHMKTTGGPLHN